MSEHKYSISEIDAMRQCLGWMFGSESYDPKQRAAEVEDRLRTHMLNGTTPEELTKARDEWIAREQEHRRRAEEMWRRERATTGR
jgi:hypothetical protein